MKKFALRSSIAAALVALVALVLSLAATAGATDAYTPALEPAEAPATTVAVEPTAPYVPAAAPKAAVVVSTPAAYTPKVAVKRTARAKATSTSKGTTGLARARSILAGYVARYPILKGTRVEFGDARGYQAVAYYRSGRIVISRKHTASLERIIAHEIWHIIDWRHNSRIDWGENVPPKNASQFRG